MPGPIARAVSFGLIIGIGGSIIALLVAIMMLLIIEKPIVFRGNYVAISVTVVSLIFVLGIISLILDWMEEKESTKRWLPVPVALLGLTLCLIFGIRVAGQVTLSSMFGLCLGGIALIIVARWAWRILVGSSEPEDEPTT